MNKPDLSLEELADANKSEFDRLFATQMALGTPIATGGAAQTLTSPHLTEKVTDNAPSAVGPHITTLLTDTYAKAWSYEIVEHNVEPGTINALDAIGVSSGWDCLEVGAGTRESKELSLTTEPLQVGSIATVLISEQEYLEFKSLFDDEIFSCFF